MSTRADSLSRQELAVASPLERIAAVFFGREGFDAHQADAFKIAIPFLLDTDIDGLERDALAIAEAKEATAREKKTFSETAASRKVEQLYPVAIALGRERIAEMKKEAEASLLTLMKEAAQTGDGSKLRSIADVVQMVGRVQHHDPLRAYLLRLKATPETRTAKQVQKAIRRQYRFEDGQIVPSLFHIGRVAKELLRLA